MNAIIVQHIGTPAGELLLADFDGQIVLCDWTADRRRGRADQRVQSALGATFETGDSRLLRKLRVELAEYFAGKRRAFDLPVRHTGTPFEARVWDELRRIPYGETISYGELARRIGNPGAIRAVAGANARNPVSILVPCHRVIAADGGLGGYGGVLPAKRILLDLEQTNLRMLLREGGPTLSSPNSESWMDSMPRL